LSFQSGFRPGHSTPAAIARVSDDIRLNMQRLLSLPISFLGIKKLHVGTMFLLSPYDDMTEVLEFSKYHMYADDLQIYQSQPRDMLF
jgi:hypothetical protein